MRPLTFGAFFMAMAACCLAGAARAEPSRQVRFDYARQEGASNCPDVAVVRAGVAARLGYEPFDERAADLVRATIRTATHGLEARVELVDGSGTLKAERRLISRQRDCAELASSVELAVSIAIDPLGVGAPPGTSARPASAPQPDAPLPPRSPSPSPLPSQAEPPPAAHARPLASRVEAGLAGSAGKAPSYAFGMRAGFALGSEVFSLGLEGQADFSARKSLSQGHAKATLWTLSLVPCARRGIVAACALATAGVLRGVGSGLADERATMLPYAALGLRLSAGIPVTSVLALVIHGDVTAPLVEESLKVGEQVVWTSPHVAAALGLGVAATFP